VLRREREPAVRRRLEKQPASEMIPSAMLRRAGASHRRSSTMACYPCAPDAFPWISTMSNQNPADEARMDADNIYREETFTDRQVGTIRVLVPVHIDGTDDASRARLFIGQASLYTPAGTLPLNFDLE